MIPLRPARFPVYASIVLFGAVLLYDCNTRYERVASSCSAGTFTPQETPSFAWRPRLVEGGKRFRGDRITCRCAFLAMRFRCYEVAHAFHSWIVDCRTLISTISRIIRHDDHLGTLIKEWLDAKLVNHCALLSQITRPLASNTFTPFPAWLDLQRS